MDYEGWLSRVVMVYMEVQRVEGRMPRQQNTRADRGKPPTVVMYMMAGQNLDVRELVCGIL